MSGRWVRDIRQELLSHLLDERYPRAALSQAAAKWLAAGVDAPEIVDLAGLSHSAPAWEVREYASAAMRRFGIPSLGVVQERQQVALMLVEAMLHDAANVREYSYLLRSLADRFYADEYLTDLDELLGLASSWDEPYADQIPSAIRVAAGEYLKAFRAT